MDNIWRVLRFYGYNSRLILDDAYLHPKLDFKSDGSEVLELSPEGWSFVDELWTLYIKVT